jgi:hypothetical protein
VLERNAERLTSVHTPALHCLPSTRGNALYTKFPLAIAIKYDGIGTGCSAPSTHTSAQLKRAGPTWSYTYSTTSTPTCFPPWCASTAGLWRSAESKTGKVDLTRAE